MPRARIILSKSNKKTFIPFDRFAQKNDNQESPIEKILLEIKALRTENLRELTLLHINSAALLKRGIHSELGKVNLKELLSTWVVHDKAI